jgi:hypothetical protein
MRQAAWGTPSSPGTPGPPRPGWRSHTGLTPTSAPLGAGRAARSESGRVQGDPVRRLRCVDDWRVILRVRRDDRPAQVALIRPRGSTYKP